MDEPTDLPEGTVVDLVLHDSGDEPGDEEQRRVHVALQRSEEGVKHGRVARAADVLRQLREQ